MKNMNCSTFKKQLEEAIENRSTMDSPEFESHRKECTSCEKFLQSSQALDYAINEWKKETFQIDFTDRVLYHLERTRAESDSTKTVFNNSPVTDGFFSQRKSSHQSSFAVISAAVLVMITAFTLLQSTSTQPEKVSVTQADEKNMELDSIIRDVGSAYLSLANDTADSVSDAMVIVSLKDNKISNESGNDRAGQYQWIRSLGNDLKPIQEDLGEAMDFLYDSLPEDSPSTI